MNSNKIGLSIIKYLLIALGLAVIILSGLFLNYNYSQIGQLSINIQTAISSFMLCAGIGFCFIAFRFVK
ncbi:hypothetical protein [Algibacillus agarilyticus]|uniref:hypothetical protein n=1 Tax=Algibacillus agarilyticus TaxID=2234133 RepID=UPI000DCFFA43|nr:hypothetical protein [Algibacillus agarilyticus]